MEVHDQESMRAANRRVVAHEQNQMRENFIRERLIRHIGDLDAFYQEDLMTKNQQIAESNKKSLIARLRQKYGQEYDERRY